MAASLELAISAIRSGRKEEGRQLLNLLIQQNPNNEQAWLWMSSVVKTDEQRARCLYHVLAINPDNELARRGLRVLGIVVTDSRPVKIPRDSQPIKIPKPTPETEAGFPSSDQLDSKPVQATERRPFRIDPQTIVSELPFTPVKDPFTGTPQVEQPTDTPQAEQPTGTPPAKQPTGPRPSKLVLEDAPSEKEAPAPAAEKSGDPGETPSKPVPAPQAQPGSNVQSQSPSQPVPVAQQNGHAAETPPSQNQESEPHPPPGPAYHPAQYNPDPQSSFAGTGSVKDTRPSQPFPVHAQPTQGMPQQGQPQGPGYYHQQPSAQGGHSNVTMGMPTHYLQAQHPSQPMPAQGWGQPNNPGSHPSEPGPSIHSSGTVQMPAYWQPQFQPPGPQNPSIHSSSTMAMPMGYDPFAAMAAMPNRGYGGPNRSKSAARGKKQKVEEESDDEVNILAVIIFGSLSVTALGGLGMLILLMFTAA
jgi:hypothetical protein